ncbi:MAG TPA: beta-propeller fold lactonase family protein [Opitutaceae bacterium]|nr:beta-propeller fold lactonase family protein [Opitutaceae bacterium]
MTLNRRTFLSLLGTAVVAPRLLRAQSPGPGRTALYASVGATLTHYDLDVDAATLTPRGEVRLPAAVQYVWPHASRRFLYVASSGPTARGGPAHFLNAFRIDPAGELTPHGNAVPLPTRPINLCSDIPSGHLLVAFNDPSAIRVYAVNPDGTPGAEVAQREPIDAGIYAHQVRVSPDNRLAILVTRGNNASATRPEDPGALKVFRYENGQLTRETSIAPGHGFGFGPRHLDFHPTQPWIYVSRERENLLSFFRRDGDRLSAEPVVSQPTLAAPSRTGQQAGTVHVHPNGRFVYGVNRLDLAAATAGTPLPSSGENSLVVFALDPKSGEPTPIQHIDTQGIHDRTFHIDPTGRLLVTAHLRTLDVKDGNAVRHVPAGFTVFRIGPDGRLEYVRKYDLEIGREQLFWMGMVPLPA